MITPELITYIETEIRRGVTNDAIQNALIGAGWKATEVAEAFREKFCRLGVDGKYHPNVSFGGSWGEHQIFLCGCQLGPYCIGRAGVTPVILEHKKL
jgi:hypothetical protein